MRKLTLSDDEPLLHLLHLGGNPLIRTIRMRPPSAKCQSCGPDASIHVEDFDYDDFCAGPVDMRQPDGLALSGEGDRIAVEVSLMILTRVCCRLMFIGFQADHGQREGDSGGH